MIDYDSNRPAEVFRIEGSNIPRSAKFSLPSVILAVIAHYVIKLFPEGLNFMETLSLSQMWSASVIVLSVLLGMRTNKAYGRFWEGITLVQLVRAEWFEAVSNLVAFSLVAAKRKSDDQKAQQDVAEFQFTLVRLMSLMHGAALRQIGGNEEEFQVLDIQAIDAQSLAYLASCQKGGVNPVEVLIHWVQVLVTDSFEAGIVSVPAPILTRVYQTLSRGMVNLHDARKLADVPFPFPFTQMVFVLLLLQSMLTPIFFATALGHPVLAGLMTFVPIFGMFSITFTAGELEHPFGDDTNDLPLSKLQEDYNNSLLMLLDEETAHAPSIEKGSTRSVHELRRKYSHSRTSSMTCSLAKDSLARALGPQILGDDRTGTPTNMEKSSFEVGQFAATQSFVSVSQPLSVTEEGEEADDDSVALAVKVAVLAEPELAGEEQDLAFPLVPPPDHLEEKARQKFERSVNQEMVQALAEEIAGSVSRALSALLDHDALKEVRKRQHVNAIGSDDVFENTRLSSTNAGGSCPSTERFRSYDLSLEQPREHSLLSEPMSEPGSNARDFDVGTSLVDSGRRVVSLGEEMCVRQHVATSSTNHSGSHGHIRSAIPAAAMGHLSLPTARLPSPPISPPRQESTGQTGEHMFRI